LDHPETPPSVPAERAGPAPEGKPSAATGAAIRWRDDLLAGLIAGAAFLLLTALADMFEPGLVWLANLVFLPVGIWLGRSSRRLWVDGTIYGLTATVLVVLLLLARGVPLLAFLSLFVVLPQGLLGAWAGARLFPAAALRPRRGRSPKESPPGTPPQA